MIDEVPPWEDEPVNLQPVTQDQHKALLRMVTDLAAAVRLQASEIASLKESKPAKVDNSTGDVLRSGKYAGKSREDCVEKHPDYVVYLADNGWAITRWGFTAEQVERARKNPLLQVLKNAGARS